MLEQGRAVGFDGFGGVCVAGGGSAVSAALGLLVFLAGFALEP